MALALGGQLQAWQGAGVAFWANLGSILACFLGSVVYHTFQAHHHCHDRLLKLDVSRVEGGSHGGVPRRLDLRPWRRSAWLAGQIGQAGMAARAEAGVRAGVPAIQTTAVLPKLQQLLALPSTC